MKSIIDITIPEQLHELEKLEDGLIGVYHMIHTKTGKVYVGSTQPRELVEERSRIMLEKAHKVAVIIDGVEYRSIKDASEQTGVKTSTIGYRLNSDSPMWIGWQYKEKRESK